MKIVRFGAKGLEKPGLLDPDGAVRDLSAHMADWSGASLSPESLEVISQVRTGDLPLVPARSRLGPPVAHVTNIIGIGLNYRAHAKEAGLPTPEEPIYFMKAASALSGPFDPIPIPRDGQKVDWEIELGVVIGSRCSYVELGNALDYVAGFVTANDISERAFQLERGTQWTKGKSCEGFAPIGPWLVTKEEVPNPANLDLRLWHNGELQQSSNSSDMVFDVAELVSYVSRFMVLLPGDVILTGTPSGVGFSQQPQRFVREGDVIRAEVSGLGAQEYTVVGA